MRDGVVAGLISAWILSQWRTQTWEYEKREMICARPVQRPRRRSERTKQDERPFLLRRRTSSILDDNADDHKVWTQTRQEDSNATEVLLLDRLLFHTCLVFLVSSYCVFKGFPGAWCLHSLLLLSRYFLALFFMCQPGTSKEG